jgi:deoxyribodipyrimidine photo-lyase
MIKTYPEILAIIDAIDVEKYEQTRNHLTGAVSRLSPYITRGCITLPGVRDRLCARVSAHSARKFIQELMWREYFQRVWWQRGDQIFSDLKPRDPSAWRHHEGVEALLAGTTGVEVIDAGIRKLYETGYLHNHLRMWIAGLSANLARAHWYPMSRWMYYHLLDGDLASNTLSWQWVAGTLTGKPYDFCQALINGCSLSRQRGTFLDVPREDFLTMAPPEVLLRTTPLSLTPPVRESRPLSSVRGQTVGLYHPFHLSPTWRPALERQILVLEPAHFERFPVSPRVLSFICDQAKALLPRCEIHWGPVTSIQDLSLATAVWTQAHPTVTHFPGQHDPVSWLCPEVTATFPSFSAFWRVCEPLLVPARR